MSDVPEGSHVSFNPTKSAILAHWSAIVTEPDVLERLIADLRVSDVISVNPDVTLNARVINSLSRRCPANVLESLVAQVCDPAALLRLAHHRSSHVRLAALTNPAMPQAEIDRYFEHHVDRASASTALPPVFFRLSSAQAERLAASPLLRPHLHATLSGYWAKAVLTETDAPERVVATLRDGPPAAFQERASSRHEVASVILTALASDAVAGLTSTQLVDAMGEHWVTKLLDHAPCMTDELFALTRRYLHAFAGDLHVTTLSRCVRADPDVVRYLLAHPELSPAMWERLALWIMNAPDAREIVGEFVDSLALPVVPEVRVARAELAAQVLVVGWSLVDASTRATLLEYVVAVANAARKNGRLEMLTTRLLTALLRPVFAVDSAVDDETVYRVLSYVAQRRPRMLLDVALGTKETALRPSVPVLTRVLRQLTVEEFEDVVAASRGSWPSPTALDDPRVVAILDLVLDLAPPAALEGAVAEAPILARRAARRLDEICTADPDLVAPALGLLSDEWALGFGELLDTVRLLTPPTT